MLRHLSIRNFAIVDKLDLEFQSGFTALTGETGAGKSILIDALALALGERAEASQVRSGAERAEIAAEFSIDALPQVKRWLADLALDGDEDLVLLRRVVDAGGRSRAFINGHAATLAQLREAGGFLVDIHGQHAHQSLLRNDDQRRLLDDHAGLAPIADAVSGAFREWQRLLRAREDQELHAAARAAETEQLSWQLQELTKLAPVRGEWEALDQEHSRLAHAASLLQGSREVVEQLSESEGAVSTAVSASIAALRGIAQFDASLNDVVELLESAHAQIGEVTQTLRRYGEKVELDPARLREVELRVESLHSASRRFRVLPQDLCDLFEQKKTRLAEMELESDPEAIAREENAARERYRDHARTLTAGRKKAAAKLSREVSDAMKELAMKGGRFQVNLLPGTGSGSASGDETVEFAVSANAGIEPRPLAKVASGGELSRISLALMVITSASAKIPTMIFDEVDAGIGGAVAEVVGHRLKRLGAERQVLCVTHLPQVAALAGHQWSVSKADNPGDRSAVGSIAASRVAVLDEKDRVEEIARMLGGLQITATTRRHAQEMLSEARR